MNFFVRPKNMTKVKSNYVPEEDIVRYEVRERLNKAVVDDKGNVDPHDFNVIEEVVEVERVNRQDYIDSFREDVGIKNILKKVALSGDVTLLNQIKRNPLPIMDDGKEMIQDVTPLQEGEEAVAALGDSMQEAWKAIPDDLKNGRSIEEFCKNVSQAEIDAFVQAQIAKKLGGIDDGTK